MFSKMKRFFDPTPEHQPAENPDPSYRELERLKRENEALRKQLETRSASPTPCRKVHIEFFLYDAKNNENAVYTEEDIHRYPMMGFTLHFLDPQGRENRPRWLLYLLEGLEQTFEKMKVTTHCVDRPDVYSQFVDLKLYPQIEVKKCIYLIFQQLYRWQHSGEDRVSLRVHIGGDELYQELLNSHLEAV